MTEAMNDATLAQVTAAAPDVSTWLSANAGSGKTRVLTDRVARLLLDEVPPERILCLTYTKAAAMEMQNRLFSRLGDWAMTPEDELAQALAEVGVPGARLTPDLLSRARTLFARAIETPGGLKIQTIHSFCASVLRRFPLEAGVSPGFTEIDERVQGRLIADLLDEIAEDPARQYAIDAVVPYLGDEDGITQLSRAVAGRAEAFAPPLDWGGVAQVMGIDPGLDDDGLLEKVFVGVERALCERLLPALNPKYSLHAAACRVLPGFPWDAASLDALAEIEAAFLYGPDSKKAPNEPRKEVIENKNVVSVMGGDLAALREFAFRLRDARPLRLGLLNARKTHALHRFAEVFLPAYHAAKTERGWLDFDDLIARTKELLTSPDIAQWVLFRLDGGIDHILVDEAQDTSPAQWDIVKRLAEDFAAGQGARAEVQRTIFVVGDKKQSIYSFQGADPEGFDRMRVHFGDRLRGVGLTLQETDLLYSFRSARPILQLVDEVCGPDRATGVGGDLEHKAFHAGRPGRVDLWPLVPAAGKGEDLAWCDPQDLLGVDHHFAVLAQALANRIHAMLSHERPVIETDKGARPVEAGDILILVRRRSPLFKRIIAALKAKGLPIAGVDRSDLTAPLAAQDLLSLLRFLATPEDSLSLAEVLRSPICGWSEDDLFRLAHGRSGHLWQALRDRAEDRADWAATQDMLKDLRDQSDFKRPYDLLERALIRHDIRRRLIARLGSEAEDGIDAMLSQALAYERMEVPSLTGFIGWLESGEVTVKRDLAQSKGEVRVMTVHGAKGLEAPVVILPDTGEIRGGRRGVRLVQGEDGRVFWPMSRADAAPIVREAMDVAEDRERAERNRLLYVALTRAESWLIVAAAGTLSDDPEKRSETWYGAVEAGLQTLGAAPLLIPELDGPGLRYQIGTIADAGPAGPDRQDGSERVALPGWAMQEAVQVPRDKAALSPSDLGGDKILLPASDVALGPGDALRRGRLVHLLLEHLPNVPPPDWRNAAPRIASLEAPDLSDEELAEVYTEAERVLTAPHLSRVFDPETLAEVALHADSPALGRSVLGVIDRLIVTKTRVLAVDFKTNTDVPDRPGDVPEGLLRQMGAYAEMLGAIYPGREIATAILWSRTAMLMELPQDLVMAALARSEPS
jgi:ATP-dependent helicase/nuclease subunit A